MCFKKNYDEMWFQVQGIALNFLAKIKKVLFYHESEI